MKKLTLRLLVLILSIYVAGSIYPLLAHEASHGPSQGTVPQPQGPTPRPASPAAVDNRGSQVPLSPPGEMAGGGCGTGQSGDLLEMTGLKPEEKTALKPEEKKALSPEEEKFKKLRPVDFDNEANLKVEKVNKLAKTFIMDMKKKIEEDQKQYHNIDLAIANYKNMLKENPSDAQAQNWLQESLEKRETMSKLIQYDKEKIDTVAAWRSQKIREIWSFRDRAKKGDYNAYTGLKSYNSGYHPSDLFR